MMDIFSKDENRLFSLIDLVRERPAIYLGEESLSILRHQFMGYMWACRDYQIDTDISFLPLGIFRAWLTIKYDNKCSVSYDGIILMAHGLDEARALNAFFADWDEFLAQDHEMLKRDFLDENGHVIRDHHEYLRESHDYSIYFLTDTRNAELLWDFLERNVKTYMGTLESNLFFPHKTCTHKTGESEIVFRNANDLFIYFERNKNESIGLHVDNYDYSEDSQGLRGVGITFTEDGHTVISLGIVIPVPQMTRMEFTKHARIVGWANKLKEYFGSGLILHVPSDYFCENPSPKNKIEFMNYVKMQKQ
ncbi:MAG: hypothetical protein FWC50_09300 [Planctomycetaceae bacterium]|nr:hypothetical protein [Planctomycetaceae bacterium]